MDPVGPWSAYAASYNRLASASGFQNASPSELHHHMGGGMQTTPPSTSQILAAHASSGLAGPAPSPFTSAGFLSPPPVGYDPVFAPLFPQKAHYSIQPPRPIKQVEADSYNQMTPNSYFDQTNGAPIGWSQSNPQLPSPFGVLPHESVVPSSNTPSKTYENFNVHFTAAQTLNQLTDYKNSSFIDPKKRSMSPPKSITSAPFFQQMLTPSDSNMHFKQGDYPVKTFANGHLQQTCSISSPPSAGKEYRVPQLPRSQFLQQRSEKPRAFTPKQLNAQKQPSKAYDSDKPIENESQSSPISFAMIDSQRNFQSNKRSQQFQNIPNQQNYRFPMTPESDYQRSKSTESFGSTSSNPECNIGLPRRPSPLHAQASPSAQAQSPVYPMYNSPLTTISSPSPVQHESCYNKQQTEIPPPLDVTVNRSNVPNSVVARTDNRYDRQEYNKQQWDERQRRFAGYDIPSNPNRQYYDPGHQLTLQDLSSCRGDPMSLVKTLQQQHPERNPEEKPKKRRNSAEKPSDSGHLPRVPPPAHHNANQNAYFDFDRWNLVPTSGKALSPVAFNTQSNAANIITSNQPQSLMVSHSGPPPPYFSPYHLQQSQPPENSETVEPEAVHPKVIVPNIAEELQSLLEGNLANEELGSKKTLCLNPNAGFMSSFIKFLQGEKDRSPSPSTKPVKKVLKPKVYAFTEPKEAPSSNIVLVPEFPSDPQDDPRYFPLPKSTDKRHFNSSDSELSENEFPLSTNPDKKETPQTSPIHNETSSDILVEKDVSPSRPPKKKEKKTLKSKKKNELRSNDSPEAVVPRRELSRRKAKEKSYSLIMDEIETENNVSGHQETDSDPAWSPKKNVSDEADDFKNRRVALISTRKSKSLRESSDEDEIPLAERTKKKKKKSLCSSKKPSEKLQRKVIPQIIYPSKPLAHSKSRNFHYNIGEFVILKADTHLRHPPLWRVKEKSMLQKYIHFTRKGMSLYRNLNFYTGWSPENTNTYQGVTVKVVSSTKQQNNVVQLLSFDIHNVNTDDRKIIEKSMEQTCTYHENFEIYVQTLFSKALDPNFLIEIFNEEDEYFLLNVRAIDSLVSDLEKRFIDVLLDWPEELSSAVQTYPSYKCQPKGGAQCHCGTPGILLLTFSDQSYNKDTLEPESSSILPSLVDFVLCRNCLTNLEVLYKLCHFKCSLYAVCLEKVNETKNANPNKDNTILLNDLLNDEAWLAQVFLGVRWDWGNAEANIEKLRTKLSPSS